MATTAKTVSDALTRAGLRSRVDAIENNLATLGEVVLWMNGTSVAVYTAREAVAEVKKSLWDPMLAFATRKDSAAVSLGRRGGQARSRAKTRAARANGKLGGRPKKK